MGCASSTVFQTMRNEPMLFCDNGGCRDGNDDDIIMDETRSTFPLGLEEVHPSSPPYLGAFFFGAPSLEECSTTMSSRQNSWMSLTLSASTTTDGTADQGSSNNEIIIQNGKMYKCDSKSLSGSTNTNTSDCGGTSSPRKTKPAITTTRSSPCRKKKHIERIFASSSNTLPSFRRGRPLQIKIVESQLLGQHSQDSHDSQGQASHSNNDTHYFSYDPYFSCGEYRIQTLSGEPYGGGLCVKMGAQFMTLQDRWGRVLAATRSRHTNCPSHIIYSSKQRFHGQAPSTHRPVGPPSAHDGGIVVHLYPWALVKKDGRTIDDDVSVYYVDDEMSDGAGGKVATTTGVATTMSSSSPRVSFGGSFFRKEPAFRSRHGHTNGIHTHTVVTRTEHRKQAQKDQQHQCCESHRPTTEIPCCHVTRESCIHDVFNVTIAPGIDPLLIICYLSIHAKMDLESKLLDPECNQEFAASVASVHSSIGPTSSVASNNNLSNVLGHDDEKFDY